jgi:hypothetical protein
MQAWVYRQLCAVFLSCSQSLLSCTFLLQAADLPPWLLDYMSGASQELYKLDRFPTALVGCTVLEAAGFLFDACHAVLLAVESTQGPQRGRMIVGDLQQVTQGLAEGAACQTDCMSACAALLAFVHCVGAAQPFAQLPKGKAVHTPLLQAYCLLLLSCACCHLHRSFLLTCTAT